MPRGKFLNHKGRSRQFTPIEELQREHELQVNLNLNVIDEGSIALQQRQQEKDRDNGKVSNPIKKLGGPVEGLIVISNPNRPQKSLSIDNLLIDDKRRVERGRTKDLNPKDLSEAKADLARLALVRKKREAAAELRLAAKRENNPIPVSK
ncbi:hypothetical protein KR093_004917, partial [Drosophila rubida]